MDFLSRPGTDWKAGQVIDHISGPLLSFRERAVGGHADPAMTALEWVRDDVRGALEQVGRDAVEYWNHYGMVDGLANLPYPQLPSLFASQEPAKDALMLDADDRDDIELTESNLA
ncbi:MAG TPA: hypothetical protein VLI04_10215 [Nocardioidaceae bacterium]|nr:hypothetical protein [Nocardioidaceae bacterium]